jgi:hypothetical protein
MESHGRKRKKIQGNQVRPELDHETCRIESAKNPFAAKVLPMSPV